jgi:predicted CoA-substrate-specific enzyme activase
MITAGIDVGAVTAKAVILDDRCQVLGSCILLTGSDSRKAAEQVMEEVLKEVNIELKDVGFVIGTGYGRFNLPFVSRQVTEISCHAKGAHHLFPDTRTVIDIGGQDAKAIRLNEKGEVIDFVMNDKCAAGTGRFLEVMAQTLGAKIEDLGELSFRSKNLVEISSMCTVFAESEVVSLIASSCPTEDIAAGLHCAIVDKIIAMANKITIIESITLTGGVINNVGVVHALKNRLRANINIPTNPQIIGALGAAVQAQKYLALKNHLDSEQKKIT